MNLKELINLTADELIKRMQSSYALGVFAKRRATFEGWLKVELIDVLLRKGFTDAVPEQGLIDVSFGDVGIELKNSVIFVLGARFRSEKLQAERIAFVEFFLTARSRI
jgi:hypothetical protein